MHLPADLPQRPAAEGARRLALALLGDAGAQLERLSEGKDPDALHDFRVALRRLRSHLRSWRRDLKGCVRERERRELGRLQESTGGGRDAEVALAWLESERGTLKPAHGFGLELAALRLCEHRDALDPQAVAELRRSFAPLAEALGESLQTLRLKARLDAAPPTWARGLAGRAEGHVEDLVARLQAARSSDDDERLHAARIAGKRLRYLLEPARAWSGALPGLLVRLKGLQDLLGEIHDAHVLSAQLDKLREEVDCDHRQLLESLAEPGDAAELRTRMRESPRPGLLELSSRNLQRLEGLFARLREEWLGEGLAALRSDVLAFAADFAHAGEPGGVRRRRYLLHSMPELSAGAPPLEIERGWLPGERIREHLSRELGPEGERWRRTLELEPGRGPLEVGEDLAPEIARALWPLTEGARLRFLRREVSAGARAWTLDEFLDRDLVLAEVELLHPGERPELPAWLAARLVREVTDEPAFEDLFLARLESRARA